MGFKSIDEILKFAIDREKEAVEFYSSLSKEATRAALKDVFKKFSEEEEKHVTLISDIAGNKEKIDSYEFRDITDLKISDYMVETEYEEGMPLPEILKIAMKKEESSVKLYRDLGTQTDNEEAKKLFKLLVQEEQKHKLALETMFDDDLASQEG